MVDSESAPHSDFGRHLAPPDSKRSPLAEDFLKAVIGATAFEKQEPKGTKEILNKYLKNVSDDLLDETYQQYVVAMYEKYPHVSLEGIQTLLDFVKLTNEKAKSTKRSSLPMRAS